MLSKMDNKKAEDYIDRYSVCIASFELLSAHAETIGDDGNVAKFLQPPQHGEQ